MKKVLLSLIACMGVLANFAAEAQISSPEGVNALGKPSMEAYKLNGPNASATKIPVEGQYFKEAFNIIVEKAPEKVHEINLSAFNLVPISKGDVIFMRWSGRTSSEGGATGQLFVQSSKNWSKSLANQVFNMKNDWQTWTNFFVSPEDYIPGTLYFNFFLGHQVQKLEIGGIEVIDCGKDKSVDEYRKSIRPKTIHSDFEGKFEEVNVKSEKAKIKGAMPPEWQDDSWWTDLDLEYSRVNDNPYKGTGSLRITTSEIRKGQTQLKIPNVPISTDWFTKISIAHRSPSSTAFKFGLRKAGTPYNYYGQRDVSSIPEWGTAELLVPPVENDPSANFMIEIKTPGIVEIDEVKIEYLSPDEIAGSADLKGNLLRLSSFPDGIAPPWNPFHECYRPENYRTDTEVIGPTGQPALRIEPAPFEPNKDIAAIVTPFFGMGGRYYTFSFWAKAENSGHQLNMRMGPPSQQLWYEPYQKVISLGKEWKRFKHSVKIPYSPDSCFLAQIFNWGPKGVFWVDGVQVEVGEEPSEFKRSGKVEAVIQPEAPYGLILEGEKFNLRLTVYDDIEEGMILKSELFDVFGKSWNMPDIPLTAGKTFKKTFTLPEIGQPPLGSYRLEYRVVEKDGKEASKIGEVLLHRVRPAKFADKYLIDSPFGVHLTPNSEMPAVARKLGFTWARMFGLHWQSVEPEKGQWNFKGLDRSIDNVHKEKICILGILEGVPVWARSWVMPNPPPKGYSNWHAKNVPPKDNKEFSEYARRMAEQYKGKIQAFETWNEPFLPGFLNKGIENGAYIHPSPDEFLEMHKAAYNGIKAGNKEAEVIFNAGAHYHAPSDKWTKELFNKGIFNFVDIVSYHSYQPSGIGYPGDSLYKATEANSNPNNPNMQVWNTEGGPGPSDIRNFYRHSAPLGKTDKSAAWGDYLVRYWISTLASGADKFFLYLLYGWGDYTASYSLMNVDGRLHPCITAFSNMAWHLEGKKYVKTHELSPGIFVYLFEDKTDTVAVILSKGIARHELVSIDPKIKARDLFGNDLSLPTKIGDYAVFFEGQNLKSNDMIAALEGKKIEKGFWDKLKEWFF